MIGRPETTEAAPYYFTYINTVPGGDAVLVLETQLDEALAFFRNIAAGHFAHHVAILRERYL